MIFLNTLLNSGFFGILLVHLAIAPAMGLFLWFLSKTTKKYSNEEIARLKQEIFPATYGRYYNILFGFTLFIMIGAILSVLIGSFLGLPVAMKQLLGSQATYFAMGDWGIIVFGFLNILGVGFFMVGFLNYLTTQIFKGSFRDYILLSNIKGRYDFDYDPADLFKNMIKACLCLYILGLPFLYLSFHDVRAVYSDKIIANKSWDFGNHIYSPSDIISVDYGMNVYQGTKGVTTSESVKITFQDGQKYEFLDRTIDSNESQDLKSLYNFLKSKQVPTKNFPSKYAQ